MILNKSELETKKMSELRHIAALSGMEPSPPSETKDQLITRLLIEAAKQPQEEQPSEESKPFVPPPQNTIEDVIKAVNPFILRGMKVYHDKQSQNWLFRVQKKSVRVRDANTGEIRTQDVWADDSGTLHQPLEVIRRCASVLMQGVRPQALAEQSSDVTKGYESVA